MPSDMIDRARPCQCLMGADRMWDSNKKNAQHLCEPSKNQDTDA